MNQDLQPKITRTNLARRPRKNPDWPITIYKYDCWPQGEIPQSLWDTARMMQSLWNDLVSMFEQASSIDKKSEDGKTSLRSKEDRRALWLPFGQRKTVRREPTETTKGNAEVYARAIDMWGGSVPSLEHLATPYKGRLRSDCYEAVIARFIVAVKEWQKAPAVKGPPRKQFGLTKINIPYTISAGEATEWLHSQDVKARAQARYVPREDRQLVKHTSPEAYLKNGHFDIGPNAERLTLHVATHRPLPEGGRIKQVALVGNLERPFGWRWSLQIRVEHPAQPALPAVDRVAGMDLGWRILEDAIRIGVIVDNAGNAYEIRIPMQFGNANDARKAKWLEGKGVESNSILGWREIWEAQTRESEAVDAIKARLREIGREGWPNEAQEMMAGIVKMRDRGLFKLRRLLAEGGITIPELDEWARRSDRYRRQIHGAQLKGNAARNDAYRQIADWIAKSFQVVAWEGDLSLKRLAEKCETDYAIEEARKYRHIASLSTFRVYLPQHLKKAGRTLQDEEAAYTTRTCAVCGGAVEKGGKLLLVCENGHQEDQDVNAATILCNKIGAAASASKNPVSIPSHLNRYVKVASGKG